MEKEKTEEQENTPVLKWKDIEIQHNKKSVPARETEIEHGGTKKRVIIRRMGWAEKNLFSEQYVEYQIIGETQRTIPRPFGMRIGALQKCIVEAPFETDIDSLNAEDPHMMEAIYLGIDKFNKFDGDLKKKSKQPSSGGKSETEN